jgi:putative ABC transport system permease protein
MSLAVFRVFTRRPGLFALAAVTMAVGFAGNMTVFSVLDALLRRPYPFPELERLVLVREYRAGSSEEQLRVTPGDFLDLEQDVGAFEGVAAFRYQELNLGGKEYPESVRGYFVTPNLFPLLGVTARAGRSFTSDDAESGRARVALLSHGFVKRRFPDEADLLGSELVLNGEAHTVVGLMPENLNYPRAVDVYLPLAFSAEERSDRRLSSLFVVARLAPNAALEGADAELESFGRKLAERYPDTHQGRRFRLLRLREEQYRYTVPMFGMLQIAGLLALILAAVNVSHLVLVWRLARSRELALRSALGAGRARLWRQAFLECLALNSGALLLALPLAFWAVELVRNTMPQGIATWVSGWREIRFDGNALGLAIATAVVASIAMCFAASHRIGIGSLYGGSRGALGQARRGLRTVLTGAQIGLALLLLSVALWLLRGFQEQMKAFQELEPGGVLTARVSLSRERVPDPKEASSYFERALAAFSAIDGVDRVAAAVNLPASNVPNEEVFFEVDNRRLSSPADARRCDLQTVGGDFFDVFRLGIRAGRKLASTDDAEAPKVAVVSRSWARASLGTEEAVGRRVRFGRREPEGPWWTIVGVADDVKQNWFEPASRPIVYVMHLQNGRHRMSVALRAKSGEVEGNHLAEELRRKLAAIDPGQALAEPVTLVEEIADSLAPLRIIGMLLSAFALVALLLAGTGVYGVVATSVAERTRELGLRMALGAVPREVLREVLFRTMRVTLWSLAIAIPVTFAVNVLLAGRLFGVVTTSPLALAATSAVLVAVAAAAALVPARAVLRLDPVRALRWD